MLGLKDVSFKTGTPTEAIFLIEKPSLTRHEKTRSFYKISTTLKVLDEIEHATFKKLAQTAVPKFETDKDKWNKELKLIEYKMLVAEYTIEMEYNK